MYYQCEGTNLRFPHKYNNENFKPFMIQPCNATNSKTYYIHSIWYLNMKIHPKHSYQLMIISNISIQFLCTALIAA